MEKEMAGKALLKKYPNRRLYDTEKSTYVTLTQVSEMVKAGRQVEVIDVKTEQDVTAFILTQIILEEAKNKNALLPAPLLHLIIRYGETVLSEFFEKYLELTVTNYLSCKKAFDEQFRSWLDIGADFSTMAQKNIPTFPTMASFMDLFSEPGSQNEAGRKKDV
jgi:polyhydroxyalkanoate synthesis repressor PhaR